jgi:isoamylase
MHVAGSPNIPVPSVNPAKRGTYAGLIDKIPYLQDLGVTAVELQPVFHFDEQDAPAGLTNYWGYFFTPHSGYSSRSDPLAVLDEFRDMVKAFHRAARTQRLMHCSRAPNTPAGKHWRTRLPSSKST